MKMNNKGFGILEVLISIGIIVVVATSSVSLTRSVLERNVISMQRTQAYNLVKEGLERARNLRDTTWVDEESSKTFESFEDIGNEGFSIVLKDDSMGFEVKSESEKISMNDSEEIEFTRTYYIEKLDREDLLVRSLNATIEEESSIEEYFRNVEVNVSWDYKNKTYDVSAATILTDWKPRN